MKKEFLKVIKAVKKLSLLCLLLGNVTLVIANDTIRLADSKYGINDVEAFYYTSGGKHYYSFIISNYDTDVPTLQIEIEATSKSHVQGSHDVLLDFTWLTMTNDFDAKIKFSKASFWLKYTGKNIDGDAVYDILFKGNGLDGKVYLFRTNMPVFAYDDDNSSEIINIEDTIDENIVNPDTPTDLHNINNISPSRKLLRNGHIFILRGDKIYTLQGQEVQ